MSFLHISLSALSQIIQGSKAKQKQNKAKQIKNPKLEGGHGTAVQKSYTVYLIHYIPISQVGDALEIQTLKEGHSMLLQM